MKREMFWRLRALVVVAVCLATTAVYAASKNSKYTVLLPGVDYYGCLDPCLGSDACFTACINTCTGKFTGSAKGCVQNLSCKYQCYTNPCIYICGLTIKSSKYTVTKGALAPVVACFTASGCVQKNGVPAS